MASRYQYHTLEFTEIFLEDLVSQDFNPADRRGFIRALRLLDTNEKHPSLRVHELQEPLAGVWSASPPDQLRLTFERLVGGNKLMLTCSRHYER